MNFPSKKGNIPAADEYTIVSFWILPDRPRGVVAKFDVNYPTMPVYDFRIVATGQDGYFTTKHPGAGIEAEHCRVRDAVRAKTDALRS